MSDSTSTPEFLIDVFGALLARAIHQKNGSIALVETLELIGGLSGSQLSDVLCMRPIPETSTIHNGICMLAGIIYKKCFELLSKSVPYEVIMRMLIEKNQCALFVVVSSGLCVDTTPEIVEVCICELESSSLPWRCQRAISDYSRFLVCCSEDQKLRFEAAGKRFGQQHIVDDASMS